MAALNRPVTASYAVDETVRVDTHDNEDHTFCGIMFPVKAKAVLPVEKLLIHSVAVRGGLGDMTVWVSNEDAALTEASTHTFRLTQRHWTKLYSNKHDESMRNYQTLDFTSHPIVLLPGQVRLIYIHSTRHGDEAIVYDNTDAGLPFGAPVPPRYEDNFLSIHSGRAHLSCRPFGQTPIWGWGNPWRDRREFVGQVNYGTVYKLWSPDRHCQFGTNFHGAAESLLMLQRKLASPVSTLPDECIYYILNMCRWDWFTDEANDLRERGRVRKRRLRALERQQRAENAHMVASEMETQAESSTGANGDQDAAHEAMQESSEDEASVGNQIFSEDEESDAESAESLWERANGYRADNASFMFHDVDSDNDETAANASREPDEHRAWFRRQIARVSILQALGGRTRRVMNAQAVDDSDSDSDYAP